MRIINCDVCDSRITHSPSSVEINDGEHPHNGSQMTTRIDVCDQCIGKITTLRSFTELSELQKQVLGTKK